VTESKDTAPSLWKLLKMAKSLSGCFVFVFAFVFHWECLLTMQNHHTNLTQSLFWLFLMIPEVEDVSYAASE